MNTLSKTNTTSANFAAFGGQNFCPVAPTSLLTPEVAYDLCANFFDDWKWQHLWAQTEWPLVSSLLQSIERKDKILDVGIGTGSIAKKILETYEIEHYHGVDISQNMLNNCRKKLMQNVTLNTSDITQVRQKSQYFDVVVSNRVLSHVFDLDSAFKNISYAMKEHSSLIVSEIDPRHNYIHTKLPYFGAKLTTQTYKHNLEKLVSVAKTHNLLNIEIETIYSDDIPSLYNHAIPSTVDTNNTKPLLNVLLFEKSSKTH